MRVVPEDLAIKEKLTEEIARRDKEDPAVQAAKKTIEMTSTAPGTAGTVARYQEVAAALSQKAVQKVIQRLARTTADHGPIPNLSTSVAALALMAAQRDRATIVNARADIIGNFIARWRRLAAPPSGEPTEVAALYKQLRRVTGKAMASPEGQRPDIYYEPAAEMLKQLARIELPSLGKNGTRRKHHRFGKVLSTTACVCVHPWTRASAPEGLHAL